VAGVAAANSKKEVSVKEGVQGISQGFSSKSRDKENTAQLWSPVGSVVSHHNP